MTAIDATNKGPAEDHGRERGFDGFGDFEGEGDGVFGKRSQGSVVERILGEEGEEEGVDGYECAEGRLR